ncbi:MAG: CDP-glycerol glycerophosphotransferase family protein [Lachnospiraceae bacterium]|nr:CDP-glycerol glycerophosphotransferase family protein [Lachnospiraceae bacterium]
MNVRNKKIWIYNAGMAFSGNPKWMFMYMLKEHPEVKGVWLCYDRKTMFYIKKLGYEAHLFKSQIGKKYMKEAGVYVVNQVKEIIQPELSGITMLNLWHGVGCKTVEQKVDFGFLRERIAKKYIRNNKFYRDNQLFLVTSPLMEEHFIKQCGLDRTQLVRSAYPCCVNMDWVKSYNHDIRKQKGLNPDTRIAVYCPTYRDNDPTGFFGKAIPDMDKLVEVLRDNNTLLIFKMHPLMDKDHKYAEYKSRYSNCPNLMFWDNANDIYEIFNQIDTAIIDYSSMFYDMLMAGVKHFVRYMFDIDDDNNLRDFVFDVKEMTCGTMCSSFLELLEALSVKTEDGVLDEEYDRIKKLFWEYESNGLEEIYNKAMGHKAAVGEEKILYSFDIFDTLIRRKCLSPVGVFAYVKQKMYGSEIAFPQYLMENFNSVRQWCESNVREYYRKTVDVRKSDKIEISFDEIYERMKTTYDLSEDQISLLKQWELEGELETCIPYEDNIKKLKKLLKQGENVVLISDMYLPKEFIIKLLEKVDKDIAKLPLFVSSEYGVQKTTKKLYLEVFSSFESYKFTKWIHYGDNPNADDKMPKQLGIKTVKHNIPKWSYYEQKYLKISNTYDSYRCAALFARFKEKLNATCDDKNKRDKAIFSYCYVSTWLVPYVAWAVNDAVKKGIECLYFISRDGHHLKRIADEIISAKGLNIKTKYIYGSRRAWRIPSYIEEVDDDFFSAHGNISDVKNYNMLLEAMHIDDTTFCDIFPEFRFLKKEKFFDMKTIEKIREISKASKKYNVYLLDKAKEERKIVADYLRQEIDFKEKFAFVEYWGRGYTQDCLARLLDYVMVEEGMDKSKLPDNIFYYLRSIYFTEGRIVRYNFLNTQQGLIMVEAVFANMPYNSVETYKYSEDKIVPVMDDNQELDKELFEAMGEYLSQFARDFYGDYVVDEEEFNRSLCHFGLGYFKDEKQDDMFVNVLAKLKDSVAIYGKKLEFAPPIGMKDVYAKLKYNEYMHTKSIDLSLIRSNWFYKLVFKMYRKLIGDRR